MPILLIEATTEVSASTNSDSANAILQFLEAQRVAFDHLKVSNISAIAPAAWVALDSAEYDGLIVLGGSVADSIHSETIFRECARNIHDIAMQHSIALGFGVIVAGSNEELEEQMITASRTAVLACVEVLRIIDHYRVLVHESDDTVYQN